MKTRLAITILLLVTGLLACRGISAAKPEDVRAVTKTRVLMQVGGPYHDQPELYSALKQRLEATGNHQVTVTEDRDQMASPAIDAYDVVIIYTTSGELTQAQEKGLVGFVESGKGLIAIHSATDSFKNSDAYWKLVGARFVTHGSGTFKVKVTAKRHAAVRGLSDFSITDETYVNDFHKDSNVKVLMRREDDGEPSAWVQYVGKGRVFGTGLGHGKEAWENPAFQRMIDGALEWVTQKTGP